MNKIKTFKQLFNEIKKLYPKTCEYINYLPSCFRIRNKFGAYLFIDGYIDNHEHKKIVSYSITHRSDLITPLTKDPQKIYDIIKLLKDLEEEDEKI